MLRDIDLYESLDATLLSLGEEKRNLVLSALETNGIPFRPSSVDIRSIDRVLFELFGMGSEVLMVLAYGRLNKKMVIGFDDSKVGNAVDKIRKWIELTNDATGHP
jgi:hypothetical protein